jgi:polar amino acid transport system permease protein
MQTVIAGLPFLLQGALVTLQIAVLATVAGSLIGVFGGLGLLYGPLWLRALLRGYIDVLRGLPLLVTIFIIYFVPQALDVVDVNVFAAVVGALSLFAGAHIAEIVRGAVASVARGQTDAARALGLTFWPRTWSVILPQALPAIIPPWTNTAIEMVKGSSLAYLISVSELLFETYKLVGRTGAAMEFYITAALLYFVICFAISRFGAWLERRVRYAV